MNKFSYWLNVYHLIWSYIHSDNFQYISMFVPQIHLTPIEHVLLWTCTPVNMIWYVWYAQLEKHWYWPWWQHLNLSFEEYQILNFIISMQIKAFLNLPWKHYSRFQTYMNSWLIYASKIYVSNLMCIIQP